MAFKAPSSVIDERVMSLGDIYLSSNIDEYYALFNSLVSSLEEQLAATATPTRDTNAHVFVLTDVEYERAYWMKYLPYMIPSAGVVRIDYRIDRLYTLTVPNNELALIVRVERLAEIARASALSAYDAAHGGRPSYRPNA